MPQPILFVSGAGLPDWIWDGVRSRLDNDSAVAAWPRDDDARLSDVAHAILARAPWSNFTIVAHSIGGTIATQLLHLAPARISGVLGICALIPKPGTSYAANLPVPARWILPLALRMAGTRPPASAIRNGLAAGIPEETADRLVEAFDPEPIGIYLDKTGDAVFPEQSGYVSTTMDDQLPLSVQTASAARLGTRWSRSIASAHLPMLQEPESVAEHIRTFLAR